MVPMGDEEPSQKANGCSVPAGMVSALGGLRQFGLQKIGDDVGSRSTDLPPHELLAQAERTRDAAREELSAVRRQLEASEGRVRALVEELASAKEKIARHRRAIPERIARIPGRVWHAVVVSAELMRFALRGHLREGLRLRSHARLIRRSRLFDAGHYLSLCADDLEARRDPIRHYLLRGAGQGLDPNPFFDTSYYLRCHHAAARYGKNPLVHYLRYGAREGLRPGSNFDPAWYLEQCPQARESGLWPLTHFLLYGRIAGVQPTGPGDDGSPDFVGEQSVLVHAPGLSLPPADRILIVDHRILTPDQDSGSVRMLAIIKLLGELGHGITFVSDSEERAAEYEERLRPYAARILYGLAATRAHLMMEGGAYRHVILSRPDPTHRFLPTVRAFAPNASVVFDTVDIHWLRMQRAAALNDSPTLREGAERFRKIERVNAENADLVLAITEHEREVLAGEAPKARIAVVPNVHSVRPTAPGAAGRSGLVFIGGFEHWPNVDAVGWFVREILPIVRSAIPDVPFYVLGSKPTEEVMALRSSRVEVTGYIPDVEPYFDRGRVFVSPLRYGAGMKGKIGQSMALGLPVVTTSIGAEGMHLVDGVNALVADTPARFAEAVLRLYRDETLWAQVADAGRRHVDEHFSERRVRSVLAEICPAKDRS